MAEFVKPRDADRWNRAHLGAYRKGWIAYYAGKTLQDCPYPDRRNYRGMITWSRTFITAWRDGFQAARDHHTATGE